MTFTKHASINSISARWGVANWSLKRLLARLQSTLIGATGAVGIVGATGWTPNTWWVLASMGLVSIGWLCDLQSNRERELARSGASAFMFGMERLGTELSPVWSAHIESSRSQMESAVAALTQRFAGIVHRLDQALKSSAPKGEQGLSVVFESSSQDLRSVLNSLSAATARSGEIHSEVFSLKRFVEELNQMAEEVASIASRTNLLAINARIEAAHAGEWGRSFGTLAQEVRKLSAMSAETGRKMGEKVRYISDAIAAVHIRAEESAHNENESSMASEAAINAVLKNFRDITGALEASSDELKRESLGIQEEIVEALVQLQFQDRVSQRMTHVRSNIDRLTTMLTQSRESFERSGALLPFEAKSLLAELESSYAMEDEHVTHGNQSNAPTIKAESLGEEVTFF